MHDGRIALDIWLPQTAARTETKEEEFVCSKDIICVDLVCRAQSIGGVITYRKAYCKEVC
jgi:hypothetical protein